MKELDLTQGSVPKVLLQFAVPFLIANVLQALYGGADLFVVGQYDDSASVAAVAIGSQVMQTITGIILGITTGTTVLQPERKTTDKWRLQSVLPFGCFQLSASYLLWSWYCSMTEFPA